MVKITNGVLAEKIDNLHSKIDDLCINRIKPLEEDNKKNTEFRQKATGVWAIVSIIGAFLGGIAIWILNKYW